MLVVIMKSPVDHRPYSKVAGVPGIPGHGDTTASKTQLTHSDNLVTA